MRPIDSERFAVAMTVMFKAFGKDPDKDISKICFMTLQHLGIEDAEYCIAQAILKEPRFPIPKDLVKYQQDLRRIPAEKMDYKPRYNKTLAVEATDLINDIMDGRYIPAEILGKMREMETKYPSVGWDDEADKLEGHYQKGITANG